MKQGLHLKLGHQLTMTPQLQQAIRLLQLSTLDLQQEIEQALQENPMLEVEEEQADTPEKPDREDSGNHEGPMDNPERSANVDEASAEGEFEANMPEDLPVDTQWEDILPSSAPPPSEGAGEDFDFDSRNRGSESLQDHLRWQLNLTRLSDSDRIVALAIIDATDANGRFNSSVEDLLELFPPELEIEKEEVTAVLHALQQFEPVGVFARDLQECLQLQLKQLDPQTPWLDQAKILINRHINQLSSGDYAQIMRRMKLSEDDLRGVLTLVRSLDPLPGKQFGDDDTEYIVPDVYVSRKEGRWVVELNPDTAPRLRINDYYAGMIKRADNSADNSYLRDNLQEAKWFLKSLQSRNETMMKVSTEIVRRQRNFLEYGEEAMKPLVLHDIAEAVEMHESTISRVTTRKYMHTPRGIFELKYFFSSHVATTSGGACSSTAIRALIRKLVAAENPRKPLSDSKLAELLEGQGIQVARRTIAKYRDSLTIPPSNERKRLV
ncbi:RNA polymerase factor sigma-54 [Congregibacter litoralis]|uniref:RNA polymerase sigma-54 factor n=1 Tax=Congregibacter litoralis KT71 TaxID=314285 RepID=A4A5C4_9GAMM|nr:RNA polymerase factor sigma-54 [Congregibacter litoralis]EAQ98995.1 RNA polymerase, sigma 54 subunit, RpoN/SigL [Congregibacter litoralis KT71]